MGLEDIRHRFDYHPPSSVGVAQNHQVARESVLRAAAWVEVHLVDGREKSTCLTKLEEALFWANASIARNQTEFQHELYENH